MNTDYSQPKKEIIKQEKELVQKCDQGDKSAWEELISTYSIYIENSFNKLHGFSRDDIDDLKQEFWVHLQKNKCNALKLWRGKSTLSTWLNCIATNKVRDFLRSKHAKEIQKTDSIEMSLYPDKNGDSRTIEEILPREVEGPLEAVLMEEVSKKIKEAINKLEANYRNVIRLREFEHLKFSQIAKLLKKPLNTVLVEYQRAKEKLSTILKPYYEDGDDIKWDI